MAQIFEKVGRKMPLKSGNSAVILQPYYPTGTRVPESKNPGRNHGYPTRPASRLPIPVPSRYPTFCYPTHHYGHGHTGHTRNDAPGPIPKRLDAVSELFVFSLKPDSLDYWTLSEYVCKL